MTHFESLESTLSLEKEVRGTGEVECANDSWISLRTEKIVFKSVKSVKVDL